MTRPETAKSMASSPRRSPVAVSNTAELRMRHPDKFKPNLRRRFSIIAFLGAMLALYAYGIGTLGFSIDRMADGTGKFFWILGLMLPPNPGTFEIAKVFMKGLVETLSMAFLGTIGAALLALPFGFLAAGNIVTNPIIHLLVRRFLDIIRGIDTLIWALIWIGVVGLGPFAGVLAIITSDFGAFGKLFSEAIESADKKPVEGIVSTGGTRAEAIRFGIVPQILPVIASQVLYYFESNTRSATIIGIVGAGGIGLYLTETIRTLEWKQTSFIIVMVLITVALIDWISGKLRTSLIGARPV